MSIFRLITGLTLAGAAIGVASPIASADVTSGQSSVSANWSGYVAAAPSSSGFSNVSGSWVEPSANCNSGAGDASFWVGLGGSGQSNALEQTGTEADCDSSGNSSHYAWYELVPAAPVKLPLTISAGDHISADVAVNGSTVDVRLTDQTTGQSSSKTLQLDSPDVSSAEWIAEAPSTCDGSGCQPVTLADFGTVNFSQSSATAGGHTGTISDSAWTAQPVSLDGSGDGSGAGQFVGGGSSAGAQPSSLSGDGSSFSVAYGGDSGSDASTSGGSGAGDGSGDPTGGYDPSGGVDPGSAYGDGSGGYGGSGYGGSGSGYGGYGGYGSGYGDSTGGGYGQAGGYAYSF